MDPSGVRVPDPNVWIYESGVALAQGERPSAEWPCTHGPCRVWISRAFLASHYDECAWRDRRASFRALCATITHERGHNLGLDHSDRRQYRVMRPLAGIVSRECGGLARWYVRPPTYRPRWGGARDPLPLGVL